MITFVSEEIERYAREHSAGDSPLLRELTKETYAKTQIPQMLIGPLEGSLLRLLVRLVKARRVLEIGTFTGYSALIMAEGLAPRGKLITCDIDPEATSIAQKFWGLSPHGGKIILKLGPALETLNTIKGPLDLVFIDADKTNYLNYYKLCFPKLKRGGLVVADNALWGGSVLKPKDEDARALDTFNKHVHQDPRAESVLLPIRDGIMIARKQ